MMMTMTMMINPFKLNNLHNQIRKLKLILRIRIKIKKTLNNLRMIRKTKASNNKKLRITRLKIIKTSLIRKLSNNSINKNKKLKKLKKKKFLKPLNNKIRLNRSKRIFKYLGITRLLNCINMKI